MNKLWDHQNKSQSTLRLEPDQYMIFKTDICFPSLRHTKPENILLIYCLGLFIFFNYSFTLCRTVLGPVMFLLFQTQLLTAKLQSALWWASNVTSTLITWLNGVSPGSSLIFPLLFITIINVLALWHRVPHVYHLLPYGSWASSPPPKLDKQKDMTINS